MKELMLNAVDTALAMGASYADIRIVSRNQESLVVKNGIPDNISQLQTQGCGIRVLLDGAWGFAATPDVSPEGLQEAAARAVTIARASAITVKRPVYLGEPVTSVGFYRTPVSIDPFKVDLGEKLRRLLLADESMAKVKGVAVRLATFEAVKTYKLFANSDGAFTEQEIIETGAGIEATAVSSDDVQRRSYPNSHGGQWACKGFELLDELDLAGNGERVAEEAVQLLSAKQCPSTVTTVILDSSQVALQIHESCGHAVELDRVLGMEASFAGTSFLTLDKLGSFRYGSELVNITADATVPGGLGTFGYDDEGVEAQRTPIVTNGILTGYLMDRETAARMGRKSNGCARAESWNRLPMIRMVNVNLEPGDSSLQQMIEETDEGIYMETNKSWSIDDKRLNFQFGLEVAWEIRNGRLTQMLKNPSYTGITPEFWNSCDAIGGPSEWKMWGLPNCGKGEPMQVAHVGHGAAPARFRRVRVGVVSL
jgi:TldD protein